MWICFGAAARTLRVVVTSAWVAFGRQNVSVMHAAPSTGHSRLAASAVVLPVR